MKRLRYLVWMTALVLGASTMAMASDPILKQIESAFVQVGDGIRPSVVNIDTKSVVTDGVPGGMEQMEDLFKFFGMPAPDQMPQRPRPRLSTGSGFILDKEGHVVTNNHVVEDAEDITVRLWNDAEYKAEVVGNDPDTDLAVIKVAAPPEVLQPIVLGDSDSLQVGQFAIAVGSPRGFAGSLSFGHVTALGREGLNLPGLRFQHFIQTDAAINLGNSGGPLCDIDGRVIGINVAIVWGAESLGFAIPVNTAKDILPQLIEKGKVIRGYLGVGISDARPYAQATSLPDEDGAFVKKVEDETPAARAGLQRYDVIREINGERIKDAADLVRRVSALPPGSKVNLVVWRDGKAVDIAVDLAEYPGAVAKAAEPKPLLGMKVQNLTPDLVQRFRINESAKGVILVGVDPASAADDAGLREGDVIIEVNRAKVASVDEFKAQIDKTNPGDKVLIGYLRGSTEPDITVLTVPELKSE